MCLREGTTALHPSLLISEPRNLSCTRLFRRLDSKQNFDEPCSKLKVMAKEYVDKLSAFIEKPTSDYSENFNLECKHFFGGAALYADDRICITLTPVGLAMKLPEETKERLFKNKKAIPLRYFPKGPIKKEYVLFPGGIDGGSKTIQKHVKNSIEYVLTFPKPKRKRGSIKNRLNYE